MTVASEEDGMMKETSLQPATRVGEGNDAAVVAVDPLEHAVADSVKTTAKRRNRYLMRPP